MKPTSTRKLVYSALCLALALLLPFLTGQIQQFGSMLAPMHLPVLLCGFLRRQRSICRFFRRGCGCLPSM